MSMSTAVNGSGGSSPRSGERTPLVIPFSRSYGALFPYYQFIRSAARIQQFETLNRTDSMVSLCFRNLASYVNDDNLPGLQSFLENKEVQVDDRDENGTTALILAASKGRSSFVRELLGHGADPNAEDADNWTALLCAAKEGHTDICLQLLEHNADIEHRDMGGWTALMWATYKGHTDTVNVLLERGADVNAHGNYHISSLLWAAGRGYVEIAQALISHGAKVNVGDKYGTTALVWASRKGHTEIVDCLLHAGANVDTAGMYSWTALLVATQGNHVDVVNLLLEHKPNVNALDKDGCSALMIACKEGYYEIATALMNCGAYINVQDRSGDTNLIHAVKGGHRVIVEALLKKYADIDIPGKDRKTAIYVAVEKGNVGIVKLLLNANPDLEIATKDGDTPLLKAVRSRNAEIVQLLLDKKAKVSATDKKGDTALHIAMRARSKAIVEILLRNPKHSQLLYRPNRAGETPYNIDINHQKTILGQIFGARRLNTNEDNENMLGYDLYSSALADMLSEPSLSMPITVGLYAKWGSGKSFLLNKLRDEMKNFAREWVDPIFNFTSLLFLIILHIAMVFGTIIALSVSSWIFGLIGGGTVFILCYVFLFGIWFASKRYDIDWLYSINVRFTRHLNNTKLILQILFCHPPSSSGHNDEISAHPIRFYFTDQTRVSSTTGGENSVVQMIGSLYDAIESDYGSLATRLYRAFKPKPSKSSTWKWRKVCCLPYVVVFEITFLCVLVAACALTVYLIHHNAGNVEDKYFEVERWILHAILITAALLLGIAAVANLYTWSRMFAAILFSQRRHLQKTIAKLDTLKSEGFLQALRQEVILMKDMVRCMDSLTAQQTRLVIFVDGLDSCEQDKVLLVLDAVHMLFSDASSPFIVILAIDPHVIAKAVEMNSRRLFSDSNIGGHSYLNNMVHLPFYLQNSGLRKVKVAQQTAQVHRKNTGNTWGENEEVGGLLGRSLSSRRLSNESALMSSTEKLKFAPRKGSRKLKMSESVASSIGSNLNKIGGAQDLTKMLLTDDYFSDVNPRSMRRLMNVVYITGRLLKAFQIDFNWYRLASWINITEQWPFRTSWIIYHYDLYEDSLDDNTSLKSLYDQIRPSIPTLKDTEPLLELDRDERKFDIFLTFHRSSLLVSDLKIFLPFTINLDPYLKKVIKEETQGFENDGLTMSAPRTVGIVHPAATPINPWSTPTQAWHVQRETHSGIRRARAGGIRTAAAPTAVVYPQATGVMSWPQPWPDSVSSIALPPAPSQYPIAPVTTLMPEVFDIKLSTLNVDGVCKLLNKIEDMNPTAMKQYTDIIRENNINGRVLLHCDLDELKKLLHMNFGDWEMFKVVIVSMREHELTSVMKQDESNRSMRFSAVVKPQQSGSGLEKRNSVPSKNSNGGEKDKLQLDINRSKQSIMEKQVTLEEQMICGALQTLNEEACEDVLEETEDAIVSETDIPHTSVIPPSPDTNQDVPQTSRSRTNSASGIGETDFVLLQSSPVGHMHWQPISISVQGTSESLSDHSSRCSSQPPSPVAERKRSNSIKMSNLKQPENKERKCKHVVINTEFTEDATQTASPQTKSRPVSLTLGRGDEKTTKFSRNRSKSIDYNSKKTKSDKNASFEKLHKLKEKLLQSSPELSENISDNESTPLVSEISSPSPSEFVKTSSSASSSFPLSPLSQKSLSPDVKHSRHKSEQNLPNAIELNTIATSPESRIEFSKCRRSRTTSDTLSSYSISPLLTGSSVSLNTISHSSLHLSRQDALDDDEIDEECDILTDVYCDPHGKNLL